MRVLTVFITLCVSPGLQSRWIGGDCPWSPPRPATPKNFRRRFYSFPVRTWPFKMATNSALPKAGMLMLVALTLLSIFVSWNWFICNYPTGEYHAPEIRPLDQKITDFHLAWLRQRQHRVDRGKQSRSNAAASTISSRGIRPAGEFSSIY